MGTRSGTGQRALRLWAGLVGVVWALGAAAEPDAPDPGTPDRARPDAPDPATPAPVGPAEVGLDALLRLPSRAGSGATEPAQADRQRWQERFGTVRGELEAARENLAQTQQELESMASRTENWQMAAPGAKPSAENSPISYKLRQDIRRQRDEVQQAERRLRELEVEASLAGVPAEWRRPEPAGDAAP